MNQTTNKTNKSRVNITVCPDLHSRASQFASSRNMSFSKLIDRALKRYVKQNTK